MIENVLHHLGGVGDYGVVSVALFFAFFIALLIWTLRLKRSYLNTMRELPLDGEPAPGAESKSNSPPEPRHERP